MAKYIYEKWDYKIDFDALQRGGTTGNISSNAWGINDKTADLYPLGNESYLSAGVVYLRSSNEDEFESRGSFAYLRVNTNTIRTVNGSGVQSKLTKQDCLDVRVKTVLIETLVAEENTFPNNGIQGDFWYVRGKKAFPSLMLNRQNIGGAKIKDSTGQIREVGNVYFKDNTGTVRNLK